ncbi:MAG: PPOX class F420-dependent oxidoreductase [Actinomycetota bacterium]|nr:MAG: PPOX class F420-dependent oxidoreductase [Actinomycetota bacterium]
MNGLVGRHRDLVAGARVSHLATVGADGAPHVVPVCHVLDGDRLVFATDRTTRKVANLLANPRAAVCSDVYSEDWASGLAQVIVQGRARVIDEGPEWDRGRALLYEKYPQYPVEAPIEAGRSVIVEVVIERVAVA